MSLTVLFPRCSTWHANRTSLPKTPVTFGESSGLINGPVLIWLSESSSVFKAEKINETKVAKRGGEW